MTSTAIAGAPDDVASGGSASHRARPDLALRVSLFGAMVLLVIAAVVVRSVRAPSHSTTSGLGRHVSSAAAAPSLPSTPPSPAVFRAGHGCGLTIGTGVAPGPVGSCSILEIGDSLGTDLGWGLARELPPGSGLTLVQLDRSSTGLANAGFYDWPAELQADLVEYQPQLVLVCLGGNDEQGMVVGGDAVEFPTAAWKSAYLARVDEIVNEAAATGAFVLWVGMPVMEDPGYSQGMQVLNGVYEQAVSSDPTGIFLSSSALFSNGGGSYQQVADVNGTPEPLRQADGIHLATSGEDVLATYVIQQIASVYRVEVSPSHPATITGW